ncbi:MAG: hypothetical protein AAF721_41500, partial [Myxococcota bacterium]
MPTTPATHVLCFAAAVLATATLGCAEDGPRRVAPGSRDAPDDNVVSTAWCYDDATPSGLRSEYLDRQCGAQQLYTLGRECLLRSRRLEEDTLSLLDACIAEPSEACVAELAAASNYSCFEFADAGNEYRGCVAAAQGCGTEACYDPHDDACVCESDAQHFDVARQACVCDPGTTEVALRGGGTVCLCDRVGTPTPTLAVGEQCDPLVAAPLVCAQLAAECSAAPHNAYCQACCEPGRSRHLAWCPQTVPTDSGDAEDDLPDGAALP